MGIHGMKRAGVLGMFAAMVSVPVWASMEQPGPGDRREPPQEAFDACKGKDEGSTVEMTTPNGSTIKATCKRFKDQLVAVPEGAPPSSANVTETR